MKGRKITAAAMAVILCLGTMPVSADQSSLPVSGVDGDLNWSIDTNGLLTVAGTGDWEGDPDWLAYADQIQSAKINVTEITVLKEMFSNCSNLTEVDFDELDTSQVTDISRMFFNCSMLGVADVSKWDTSHVTDMNAAFYGCSSLTDLDVSSWNTGSVTDMTGLFEFCRELTVIDVSKWDTGKVTEMGNLFGVCVNVQSLDLSEWDTSNVNNMEFMFADCSSLESLDLSNFNTHYVTCMRYMFVGCKALHSVKMENWDMSRVKYVDSMFAYCYDLSGAIVFSSGVISSYTDCFLNAATSPYGGIKVYYAGNGTAELAQAIANTKSDNSAVTYVGKYYGDTGVEDDGTGLVINETNFPGYTSKLTNYDTDNNGILTREEAATVTELLDLYGDIPKNIDYFVNLERISIGVYQDTLNLAAIPEIKSLTIKEGSSISSLDFSENTQLEYLELSGLHNLTQLDVTMLPALQTLRCYGDTSLTNLVVAGCQNLETLYCNDCTALTSLNLSGCTKLKKLVCGSTALTSLDVSDCTELDSIDYKYSSITDIDFSNNSKLTCVNGVTYYPDGAPEEEDEDLSGVNELAINNTNFPRYYTVLDGYDTDGNGILTRTEAAAVKNLNYDFTSKMPQNISFFENLETFNISQVREPTLNLSKISNVKYLSISYSNITALDFSQTPKIETLYLTEVDNITSLDLSMLSELQTFRCAYCNDLTEIKVSGCEKLETVDASGSRISSIKAANCPNLVECYLNGVEFTPDTSEDQDPEKEEDDPVTDGDILIDEEHFPDSAVREVVANEKDLNGDGYISAEEIAATTTFVCRPGTGTHDLAGIEYFTNLTSLRIYNYSRITDSVVNFDASVLPNLQTLTLSNVDVGTLNLTQNHALTTLEIPYLQGETIDLSGNTELTSLTIGGDNLSRLDISGNKKLTTLTITHSAIVNLDLSGQTSLTDLTVEYCAAMTGLNLSGASALSSLMICYSLIGNLNLSANTVLTSLNLNYDEISTLTLPQDEKLSAVIIIGTNLTELDLSSVPNLAELCCDDSRLKSLNVSQNGALCSLSCKDNVLTELDLSHNPNLTILDCSYNKLSTLDLTQNGALTHVYCSHNRISGLDLSASSQLVVVDCSYNWLSELDTSANTQLNESCLNTSHNPISATSGNTGSTEITVPSETGEVPIDEEHFPDTVFRNFVENFDLDHDAVLSNDERDAVEEISIYDTTNVIFDLSGISYFENLKTLKVVSGKIDSLVLSGNPVLEQVEVSYCSLDSLNVTGCQALRYLDVTGNNLETLDVSGCPELQTLICSANNLRALNLSGNAQLKYLDCTGNMLEGLDTSCNPGLTELYDSGNTFNYMDDVSADGIEITLTNFKNTTLYNSARENWDIDRDGYLSEREIASVRYISMSVPSGCLKGIEYFTHLDSLSLRGCHYMVDAGHFPQLRALTVCFGDGSQYSDQVDLSQNSELEVLVIAGARLGGTLDISSCTALKTLRVDGTYKEVILPENPALTTISWDNGEYYDGPTSLDFSSCSNLVSLTCILQVMEGFDYTGLADLNISGCSNLMYLDCSSCNLSALDLSSFPKLRTLNCSYNNLSALDVTACNNLVSLDCRHNNLGSLNLSCNPGLTWLMTYANLFHTDTEESFEYCAHSSRLTKDSGIRDGESYMEFTCPDCGGIVGKWASVITAQGTAGENSTWYIDGDNTALHIEGSGTLTDLAETTALADTQASVSSAEQVVGAILSVFTEDVYADEMTSADYLKKVKSIFIGEGITVIGEKVFGECTKAEYVSIPSTVTTIEDYAFEGTQLTELTIPEGVTEIGTGAFAGCTEMGTVVIPDSVVSIGENAFENVTLVGPEDSIVEEYCENTPGVSFLNEKCKNGHTPAEEIRANEIAPTYDKEGSYERTVYCTVCGAEYIHDTVIIPKLERTNLAKTSITLDLDVFIYDGEAHQPQIMVSYNGSLLTEGTDYTVLCDENVKPGTHTLTITGEGDYTGTITRDFTITKQYHTTRYAGNTRFDTAIETANALKASLGVSQFSTVVIASGVNFPDALAGSPLAAQLNAPILLVDSAKGSGTAKTIEYIDSNLVAGGMVYILGGTSAVPEEIETTLQGKGFSVKRLSGDSRYDTNLEIINNMNLYEGMDVVIVRGFTSYKNASDKAKKKNPQGYADSLSIAGVAGYYGMPIFLAGEKGLTDDQMNLLTQLKPTNVYVIGGTSAVSDSTFTQIQSGTTGNVKRIWGENRYETSVAIAEEFGMQNADTAVIAYGQNYPDGLTGGVLAAKLAAPVLLTEYGKTSALQTFLKDSTITELDILGGTSVLSDSTISVLTEQ